MGGQISRGTLNSTAGTDFIKLIDFGIILIYASQRYNWDLP
jgi:hypothetical protein